MSLGIEVVRSRPGKPTDNGGHERMHADVRVEIQEDAARTRVDRRGNILRSPGTWGVYVSLALAGYPVGLEERVDGFVYVWFFDRVVGRYQRGERTVQPLPVDERDAALMRPALP
jgi:transposase InsO family protein